MDERANGRGAWQQLQWLGVEIATLVNGKWWRWYSCWFSDAFWIIATYRLNRCGYLLLGRGWSLLRVILAPLFFLLRPWTGRHEIHYEAQIGRGLRILHPALGVQISKRAIIGENLELAGGNAIGRRRYDPGDRPVLGNGVRLGMGAVVLGPIRIGDNARIGAGAVAIHDVPANATVGGVPAVILHKRNRICPIRSSPGLL